MLVEGVYIMKNLKKVRIERKMSQQEIAKKLNISQATYWGYEVGKYEPNIELLLKMSEIFKVSVDYLLGNKNDFSLDLSNMSSIKKELLLYYYNQDEFDTYESWRAIKDKEEWERENPDKACELRNLQYEERQKEKEHFEYIINKANKQNKKENK